MENLGVVPAHICGTRPGSFQEGHFYVSVSEDLYCQLSNVIMKACSERLVRSIGAMNMSEKQ